MRRPNSPISLWEYCRMFVVTVRNLTATNYSAAQGHTPYEVVTGDTPDISEYMAFTWYQLI